MSALGQKQTFALRNAMSALPLKADMCSALGDVRFVPIADISKHCVKDYARACSSTATFSTYGFSRLCSTSNSERPV